MEAGEFLRQVKLIIFLRVPKGIAGYGLHRVTYRNTPTIIQRKRKWNSLTILAGRTVITNIN